MNIKELHGKYADEHSPNPEGQVRWLQKQGFPQHQIDQAFILLYQDLERGQIPRVFEQKNADGIVVSRKYGPYDTPCPTDHHSREISNGWDLDQCLLECAKIVRTNELQSTLVSIEAFEKKLRKKWSRQVPWYKRIFGVKPKEE